MEINNVPSTAPMFNGATKDVLKSAIDKMRTASHHYADDSGREWGKAKQNVSEAAKILNENKLGFRAISCLHQEARPIMALDDIVDAVLIEARA